ncbi:MAG: amidohydrolase, partial [Bacteroidetes bacterium]|nr:amidohydrolase [Bacteroidota bacterium]
MREFCGLFLVLFVACGIVAGQETWPVNGVYDEKDGQYAFTNATIIVDPQTTFNGTLLIKEGIVVDIGKDIKIPKGTAVYDLAGKYIYPSFIDLYTSYGLKKPVKPKQEKKPPQHISKKPGAYGWNQTIKPEVEAAATFVVDAKKAQDYRKAGFGCVLTHNPDGVVRGTA